MRFYNKLKNVSLTDNVLLSIEYFFDNAADVSSISNLVRILLEEHEKVRETVRIRTVIVNLFRNILSYNKETNTNSNKKAIKICQDDLSLLLVEYHNIQNFLVNDLQLFNDIANYIVKNNLYNDFKIVFLNNISNVHIY
jgi:hypothetical protein